MCVLFGSNYKYNIKTTRLTTNSLVYNVNKHVEMNHQQTADDSLLNMRSTLIWKKKRILCTPKNYHCSAHHCPCSALTHLKLFCLSTILSSDGSGTLTRVSSSLGNIVPESSLGHTTHLVLNYLWILFLHSYFLIFRQSYSNRPYWQQQKSSF